MAMVACSNGGASPTDCADGDTRPCYTGPPGTENVGACASGLETCTEGTWPGLCLGDKTPFVEHCNGKDDDCNGVVDDVDGAGDACTDTDGCAGARACEGTALGCVAPPKNECGLCGGPAITNLGADCSANGCAGTFTCNTAGDAAECAAPMQNACGVCGGPAVTGLGDPCMSTDSCDGMIVCNVDGSAGVCDAPDKNECGLCGGPALPGFAMACSANGCTGTNVCNASDDGLVCNAPVQNECAVCGGPPVTGIGDPCTDGTSGCASQLACNAQGDNTTCTPVTRNACNLCGGPPITGLGNACHGDRGCLGALVCNGAGDGTQCQPDAPCTHVVISEVATGSSACSTDEYVELYNPSSRTASLAGYTLRYHSTAGTTFSKLVAFAAGAAIAPHGYFLVASARSNANCPGSYTGIAANTVTADATFVAVDMSATSGQLWLTTADQDPTGVSDIIVADMVGYGGSATNTHEGTNPAAAPASGGSIERKANATSTATTMAPGGVDHAAGNGYDSDDNVNDFVSQAAREPQNSASISEP
jgi:hypothetical protein